MSIQKPKHIALISLHTCPNAVLGGKKTGGMNVYIRELVRVIAQEGVQVDIFTASHTQEDEESATPEGVRLIHIPLISCEETHPFSYFPYTGHFADQIIAFAEKNAVRYDIIYSHYWLSGVAGLKLKEVWGIPVVQMFHTLERLKPRLSNGGDKAESKVRESNEEIIARKADRIIAATEADAAGLVDLYHAGLNRIRIIPPGVNLSLFSPLPIDVARETVGVFDPVKRIILFVGRMDPIKGLDTLLQAISLYRQRKDRYCSDLNLYIIGGEGGENMMMDPDLSELSELATALELDGCIRFLGTKPQKDLSLYYSAADILVMPSYYESFGMVALEAMACGTPVIASEVGGLQHLVQDGVTGFHIPPGDKERLCEKIDSLLYNTELRKSMADNAIRHAQSFSWEIVARHFLALITELI